MRRYSESWATARSQSRRLIRPGGGTACSAWPNGMEPSLRRSYRSCRRHPLTTESFINFANICSDSRAPTTIRTDASLWLFRKSAVSLEGSMVSPRPGDRSGDQLCAEPRVLSLCEIRLREHLHALQLRRCQMISEPARERNAG